MSKQKDAFAFEDNQNASVSYPTTTAYEATPAPAVQQPPMAAAAAATTCAKCAQPLGGGDRRRTLVMMACAHMMHGACFVATANAKQLAPTALNENFGGPEHCGLCLSAVPRGSLATLLNDRADTLRQLQTKYANNYPAYEYAPDLANVELSVEKKRLLLNVKAPLFGAEKVDFTEFGRGPGCLQPLEIAAWLMSNDRSLTTLFSVPHVNLLHVYRLGVTTLEALLALGFNPSVHCTRAYREKSPLWMLSELYGVDCKLLLRYMTANQVIDLPLRPNELWLAGGSMELLVGRGLTDAAFRAYTAKLPIKPDEVFRYLELDGKHLIALGVHIRDLPRAWSEFCAASSAHRALLATTTAPSYNSKFH